MSVPIIYYNIALSFNYEHDLIGYYTYLQYYVLHYLRDESFLFF